MTKISLFERFIKQPTLIILCELWLLFIYFGIGWIIGDIIHSNNNELDRNFEKQAIENNCAQHNPITGEFEWIKK
jgi:hypothetical protein